MRQEVLDYIIRKKEEKRKNEEARRRTFARKEGIATKEYTDECVAGAEYDSESGKYIVSTPLELTNEEYEAAAQAKEEAGETGEETGNIFQWVVSFLFPFMGFFMGGILLCRNTEEERNNGKICVGLGIGGFIIGVIIALAILRG